MKKLKILSVILVLSLFFSVSAKSQDAATILKNVDNVLSGSKDMSQDIEITLIDKVNRVQTRKAFVKQKGNDKRLFKFTEPAEQKGVGFLSLPNDVMYLYMPAFDKERRIASSVKNQKFAGTDMSYDDLEAKNYSDKYTAELTKTEENIYFLKLTPKTQGEYSYVELQINKTTFIPLQADYYNKGNQKIKTSIFEFVKEGKYWYPKTMTVKDLKTNHTTIMRASNIKFDQNLSDDLFTIRNLKF